MIGMRIALTGCMRSGKDEAARHLVAQHGFIRLAFGDGIREVCRLAFPELMTAGAKPRALYQGVGQDLRQYDEDVWVKHVLRRIEALPAQASIVVSDLRQPNEWRALKEQGFTIVRISASEYTRLLRCAQAGDSFTAQDFFHPTEAMVGKLQADVEITNDGTLADLHAQLNELVVNHK